MVKHDRRVKVSELADAVRISKELAYSLYDELKMEKL